MLKSNTNIKSIFKIIGAAEATANLLCELSIAPKKEDKLTNNKNGKVILVNRIVNSNFSEFSVKPGAIKKINVGIKISITKIKNKRPIKSKLKMLFANCWALFFPWTTSEE